MSILEKAFEARNQKVNKVETTKSLKMPMDVYARLEEIAATGYEGLAKEDSAYFLKCFGLFDKGEDFMLNFLGKTISSLKRRKLKNKNNV